MNRILIKKGLHFWWQGREYVIKQRLEEKTWQIVELKTEAISNLNELALINLFFQGEVSFESPLLLENEPKKVNYLQANFPELPEAIREATKRKYQYVTGVLAYNLTVRTPQSLLPIIKEIAKTIKDEKPPTWLTLYRWLKTYEKSGDDIRSLIPKHQRKGNYNSQLNPVINQMIEKGIKEVYLTPIQADIADVIDEVICQINQENNQRKIIGQELLKIPHRSTIYRAVSKLEKSEIIKGRYGKRMGNYLCEQVQKSPPVSRPLERVEIDHTKLPLFVVSSEQRMPIGRPWLTVAIDKYSGVIMGYYLGFDPPSYLSVMQCLKNLIEPKSLRNFSYLKAINKWDIYGLPEVSVVDNGKEFYSTHFEDACLSLGIVIQYSPPKMPWYKGAIERYFGSLNSQLLSEKPGKTLANLFNLSDYNPQENAVISFEALSEIIYLFIVDIYNQSSHPEFGSPRSEVWSKGIAFFPPALPSNKDQLSVLIGQIAWRKISRQGIEFAGLIYNSNELARLRSQGQDSQVTKIKYDPTNLALIYVFDEAKQQFLEVPALNQDYTLNLTLWQHQIIKKLARLEGEKVDIVALALAKEKIQKLVAQEWKKTKKGKTRQTLARWLGLGREDFSLPKEEESSEILAENLGNISLNSSQVNPLANLSEIGNALILVENENLEAVTEFSPRENQVVTKSLSKKKQGEFIDENSPTEQLKISEEFEPNLSGWVASYGLPKSPTKL